MFAVSFSFGLVLFNGFELEVVLFELSVIDAGGLALGLVQSPCRWPGWKQFQHRPHGFCGLGFRPFPCFDDCAFIASSRSPPPVCFDFFWVENNF